MWDDDTRDEATITPADTEYVERVRRNMARLHRWRPYLLSFYGLLLIAFVGILVAMAQVLNWLAGIAQGIWQAFAVGVMLGSMVGLLAVKVAHGMANVLLAGRRRDRLLVLYYDALQRSGHKPAV
jgi:hypothetical protein